jgi:hypothetical protein
MSARNCIAEHVKFMEWKRQHGVVVVLRMHTSQAMGNHQERVRVIVAA